MNVLIVDDDMATVDVICKSVNWSALHIDKVKGDISRYTCGYCGL